MTIRALSKSAQAIFDHLLTLTNADGYVKVDNGAGYMPVTVERICVNGVGPVYSVAHYYESQGDLMRDPEITFQLDTHGRYVEAGCAFPTSTCMDGNPFGYRPYVEYDDECGRITGVCKRLQRDAASFSTTWFRNIKSQQEAPAALELGARFAPSAGRHLSGHYLTGGRNARITRASRSVGRRMGQRVSRV